MGEHRILISECGMRNAELRIARSGSSESPLPSFAKGDAQSDAGAKPSPERAKLS